MKAYAHRTHIWSPVWALSASLSRIRHLLQKSDGNRRTAPPDARHYTLLTSGLPAPSGDSAYHLATFRRRLTSIPGLRSSLKSPPARFTLRIRRLNWSSVGSPVQCDPHGKAPPVPSPNTACICPTHCETHRAADVGKTRTAKRNIQPFLKGPLIDRGVGTLIPKYWSNRPMFDSSCQTTL